MVDRIEGGTEILNIRHV